MWKEDRGLLSPETRRFKIKNWAKTTAIDVGIESVRTLTMSFPDVKYEVDESEDDLDVFAMLNGACVGKALCLKNGNMLKLADIEVNIHLRNLGIGSDLLRMVRQKVDDAGIKEIWGIITREDLQETPHLLDWYMRQDFTVLEPDADTDPRFNAVKKIVCRR